MMSARALYSDGRFLGSHPVSYAFTGEGRLLVEGEGVALDVPLGEVRFSEPLAAIPRFIYLPDGGVLETPDQGTGDATGAGAVGSQLSQWLHRLEGHSGIAAVATIVLVALVAAGLHFGLPRLAQRVAERTPVSIEVQAGEAALTALRGHFPPSQLSREERRRVHRQLARLRPEQTVDELPRLEFRAMAGGMANAFALPGNILIVTDDFVRLATDDEIAAVLAHELGHLHHRHGLQSALRHSFALLFVTALTGDLSTLTSVAGTLPFMILQNGYSRDLEREADEYAHELLEVRGIDPRHFSNILRKLEAGRAQTGRAASYLSTHPSTAERVARFGVADEAVLAATKAPSGPVELPTFAAELPEGVFEPDAFNVTGKERDVAPKPVFRANPVYPPAMRAAGMTGEVVVGFIVDNEGLVREAQVLRSSHPAFEAAALESVSLWIFQPGRKDGRAVNTRMQVPIVFSITEDAAEP